MADEIIPTAKPAESANPAANRLFPGAAPAVPAPPASGKIGDAMAGAVPGKVSLPPGDFAGVVSASSLLEKSPAEPGKPEGVVPASPAAAAGAKAPLAEAPKESLQGFLDIVNLGRAEGWAVDKQNASKRVQVEIWDGETLAAVGVADKFRPDLKKAGIGDGNAFFSIPLPRRLYDGKEHVITARLAGRKQPLHKTITIVLPAKQMSAAIESVDGVSASGWIQSASDHWESVDLLVDGKLIQTIDVPPNAREPVNAILPVELLDGCVHWFQFKLHDDGQVIGDGAAVTPVVATPEDALQRYARSFPPFLSANAHRRYASLERQFALAPKAVAAQKDGPEKLDLPSYIAQIHVANAQVMFGVIERRGAPPVLKFPQYDKPKVSVVVPLHNKFWVTYNCLASLILAPNEATAEIILVDDGSSDQTTKLADFVTGVTILRNETAQGFVKSSNRGASIARGDYVVMLNNDTEPCAGWLDELIYVFDHFDNAGLVGSKLLYPTGKLQEAGGVIFSNFDAWNYGRNQNPYDPKYSYVRQVDYVSGAAIMLRKEVWDELGGFDEYFAPAYYEDTDLAFRVRAMGLKTFFTPFSEVIHFEGISSGTSTSSGIKRYQKINEPKFRGRWAATIRQFPGGHNPDLAKDRGVELRALVIDAQTPQPDKDAGSYAAINEMRLLQALGVKLTFIPQNLAYLGNYTEALQKMGVECLYAPYQMSVEDVITQRGAEFDFFYITRYSVANSYVDLIRQSAPRAKIAFCNADLHFLREIRAARAANNPELMQLAVQTREIELGVMRKVDVTLSYTETEAVVIESHNLDESKVMKCPWIVEVEDEVPSFKERAGLAFLGNYQHPPNEEAVQFFVNEIMPELRRRVPGVKFHIFGANMPDRMLALAADDVIIEGYADDVRDAYHRFRIFVAPLRSGAGIKGKVVGAMASGLPSVLSPIAAEGVGVSKGAEAEIAEKPADWVEAIAKLYSDESRWTDMSNRARAFSAENFSFALGLERMRSALAAAGVYVG